MNNRDLIYHLHSVGISFSNSLVADVIVFNSQYNLESFLRELPRHLKLQPDHRPDAHAIAQTIRDKSQVGWMYIIFFMGIHYIKCSMVSKWLECLTTKLEIVSLNPAQTYLERCDLHSPMFKWVPGLCDWGIKGR